MKTASLFAILSLALSASAASGIQQNNKNTNVFGGNRGAFGNNNGFGQFGSGKNGQNAQNGNNNAKNANAGKNANQNKNNTGKNAGAGAAAGAAAGVAAGAAAGAVAGKANNAGAAANNSTGAAANTGSAAANNTGSAAANNTGDAAANNNGAAAAAANNADPQSSTTLDPKVIATGFENNGQDVPEAGQVASLTSSNNFINFCLTVPNLPITNGKQITTGSCNPAPMGVIPSVDNMPSAKFVFPTNGGNVTENTAFTIQMAVANFQTGAFVNAQENYFSAPQQLNGQGQIIGHSHVVVEQLSSLDQTTPTDPKKFAFFKGLNAAAVNGVLTADVTSGLPSGFYKVSSINTAANHQPVLVPIAQHGSLDDVVYFTVTAAGGAAVAAAAQAAPGTAAAAAVPAGAAAAAGTAAGNQAQGKQGKKGKRAHARAFL